MPQMEKRSRLAEEDSDCHLQRARLVLQRGLTRNPDSASLCQVSCSHTGKVNVVLSALCKFLVMPMPTCNVQSG